MGVDPGGQGDRSPKFGGGGETNIDSSSKFLLPICMWTYNIVI